MGKPYRTWEVKENTAPPGQYVYPWHVLEMNPKKRRLSAASMRGFDTEEAARIYAAMRTDEDAENERKKSAKRLERAAAVKAVPNPFKPGMIFENSWGYDQTNVDYYQVTRVTPRGVYIRPIACKTVAKSEGFMSDQVVPARDSFKGPEVFKAVRPGSEKGYLAADHGCMSLLEGDWDAHYRSWYA